MKKHFRNYEKVAAHLLNEFRFNFGLNSVEGKQKIKGHVSGTTWELDAKGLKKDGEGFIIVECRRKTTSRLNQESLAAIAYRIYDAGAAGGIVVSPFEVQKGAKLVAVAENIVSVQLNADSTNEEYVMAFLNQVMIGTVDRIPAFKEESITAELIFKDGKREKYDLS